MKRALLVFAVALGTLAGCGSEVSDLLSGDTCTSGAAKTQVQSTSCTLSPGSSRTINITLCSQCNDSSPSCPSPDFVNGTLELSPVVKQCQSTSGCATSGCNAAARTATCYVDIPAASGSVPFIIAADQYISGTIYVQSGGPTNCTL